MNPPPVAGTAETSPARERHFSALITGVAIVGGVSWLVDTALLWVLDTRLGVPVHLAAAIGFAASGVVNYLLNRIWFRAEDNPHGAQIVRFFALFLVNLAIVTVGVPLLAQAFGGVFDREGLRLLVAKVILTAVMLLPNTFAYRRWVFAVRA